jgi:signal transduction histidine kinase
VSDPSNRSSDRFRPLRNGILAGVVLLLVTGAALLNFHQIMSREADASMRNSLRRAALACALTVDPAEHASLTRPGQEGSPPYVAACDRLQAAKDAMEGPEKFRFVYTCVMRGEKVYFILDPTPAGDADGDGVDEKSHLMQPYPEASKELVSSLRSGAVTVMKEPQRDPWGVFLSAYAPIKNSAGEVIAAAGVDMELAFYQKQVREIRETTLAALLSSLAISAAAGFGVWFHQRRLHATMERLREATIAAQAASKAKDRFLATMSHEIRTPLNGVLGMTELLLSTPLDAAQRDYARTIQASGDHLLVVLNDILDFSKIEAGSLPIVNQSVCVEGLVGEVVKLFGPQAGEKGLRLIADVSEGTPAMIDADPGRLRQVLVNLVSNAVKFTQAGNITVSAAPDRLPDQNPGVRFTVADTGIGIPEGQRDRLFQPFSQVDSSTTRQHEGTGLGLAICDRLCRAMGCRIELESTPGKGSSFHFVLPAPAVARTAESGHASSSPSPNDAVVVCGDRLLRTLFLRLLEKQGWRVFPADSVANAREFSNSPGLVVFDLSLARGPASAFAEETIRALPAARHLAIDAGLTAEEQGTVLRSGVSQLLPRNPSVADLSAYIATGVA